MWNGQKLLIPRRSGHLHVNILILLFPVKKQEKQKEGAESAFSRLICKLMVA